MEVIVPDEFLSIAIGKKGQNVRLASKLTGWHLDVKSETRYSQAMQTGYDSLVALPGVGVSMADALYESGFYSAEEIASADLDDLMQIRGIGEEKAARLLEAARNAVAAAEAEAPAAENDKVASATDAEVEDTTNPAAEDADADDSSEQPVEDADVGPDNSPESAQSSDELEQEKKIEPLGGSNGKD